MRNAILRNHLKFTNNLYSFDSPRSCEKNKVPINIQEIIQCTTGSVNDTGLFYVSKSNLTAVHFHLLAGIFYHSLCI